jgi:uncharacterized protein (DUF2147 family)
MTMRHSLLLAASLSLLPVVVGATDSSAPPPAANATQAPADAILGRWKAPEGGVVVSISRDAGGLGGSVVESPEKPELVGKPMFRSLVYDAKAAEWTGEVYAVKRGEFVPAVIKLSSDGFVLTAGKGFFSKKLNWTRG